MTPSTQNIGAGPVVVVNASLESPLGGAEQYSLALVEWLRMEGKPVVVASVRFSDDVRERVSGAGADCVLLRAWRPYPSTKSGPRWAKGLFHLLDLVDFLPALQLSRIARQRGASVIHIHRFQGIGVWALALRWPRIVHTVHDFALVDTRTTTVRRGQALASLPLAQRARTRLLRSIIAPTTSLIFPSMRTRNRHENLGFRLVGRDESVVPHGWSVPAPPVRDSSKQVTFLYCGKLAEHKGVRLLLDAWGNGISGARLVFAGEGELAPEVEAAHRRGTIEFRGWVDAMGKSAALGEADAVIVPSLWPENFPLVVAESISLGKPVITTELACPPLVSDGATGLVVRADAGPLRAALERLVSDRALLARLSEAAKVEGRALDPQRHLASLLKIYAAGTKRS